MRKPFVFALLLSIGMTIAAQQYSSLELGKVTTLNNVDVIVTVDSAGTIILSTPAHSVYIEYPIAASFGNILDAILAGMRDLEAKDITVVDHRVIGKLTSDGSHDTTVDGMMFHFELNSAKDNKVLLLMYSTRDMEDMLFTTDGVAQLSGLVDRALKSGVGYGDQYAYIQSVIDKIDNTAFR